MTLTPHPGAPSPDTGPPAQVLVRVDADTIARPDGGRPHRRDLVVNGRITLHDLLGLVDVPLRFTDEHGVWVAVHGTSGADGGEHVLGVVVQAATGGPGATGAATATGAARQVPPTVHVTSDVAPGQLLDADGTIDLYFRSAPGPVDEVVAAAELGEVYTPPRPHGIPPDNMPVHAALAEYAEAQTATNALNVLRQALGGQLVLDATGSRLAGTPEHPRERRVVINFIRAPDGSKALPAFTHHTELVRFREDDDGGPQSIVQPAAGVLEFFVGDPDAEWLYINPAGPPLGIRRDQVAFALRAGHNAAVKDALTRSPLRMQVLFDALRHDDGVLFVGDRGTNGAPTPLTVRDGAGNRVLLAFTSAVEAAAWDQSMRFRRLAVATVLELVLETRAAALLINPGGPSATVPANQVWQFLGRTPQDRDQ
ncbi:SseB family protein [Georgenia sp. SYP-B2076]|uniref:SseB family protein n=1 Tax=Georgenia sp. SYP-B2076 TaxID=2495881 RepID=UPI0013E0988C|nr:SseB family protein [Georgenia sp. SYP-B2076]